MSGVKFDQEKPRMELVDALAVEGLAAVLTFGAKKYSSNNWRGGLEYTRLIGALKRHMSAIERGEDIDPESGLPHIDHLGCCWMFLSNFMKTRRDLDDRWKPTPVQIPTPAMIWPDPRAIPPLRPGPVTDAVAVAYASVSNKQSTPDRLN